MPEPLLACVTTCNWSGTQIPDSRIPIATSRNNMSSVTNRPSGFSLPAAQIFRNCSHPAPGTLGGTEARIQRGFAEIYDLARAGYPDETAAALGPAAAKELARRVALRRDAEDDTAEVA